MSKNYNCINDNIYFKILYILSNEMSEDLKEMCKFRYWSMKWLDTKGCISNVLLCLGNSIVSILGNIWFAHIMIMIANGSYLSTFICTFNTFVRPTPIMFVVVFGRKPLCSTLYERWNDAFAWCEIKTDEMKIVSLIPRWYKIEC